MRLRLLAALLLAPLPARAAGPAPPLKSIQLVAYDPSGKLLDLPGFLSLIGRADRAGRSEARLPTVMVSAPDDTRMQRAILEQRGPAIALSWARSERVQLSLPWPVAEDGFSTVWADKDGNGYADGETVLLNEALATTQYRRFKEALRKHMSDWTPIYKPGAKSRKLAERAKALMAEAHSAPDEAGRAMAFDEALAAVSAAWQKMLFEHGTQIARTSKSKDSLRFGLVIDESILQRLDQYEHVITAIKRSGANWVRLVFRSNPDDFIYAKHSSFVEYDAIVAEIRKSGLRIMATVLDTGQWPSALTPQVYAERVKNLVLHYRQDIRSWEIGSEINGDWLGGTAAPLSPAQVYRIYAAGAARVKEIEPDLETVATLYWWDGTAPDEEHTTIGWLKRYSRLGFGRNLDVLAVSLQPDDNPVGMAFETIFDRMQAELPDKRLMLGSLGYVEKDALQGYWWFDPKNLAAAREDILVYATTASCAAPRSLCGGFWWQTLDQLIPSRGRVTPLYRSYARTLRELGR